MDIIDICGIENFLVMWKVDINKVDVILFVYFLDNLCFFEWFCELREEVF